MLFEGNAVEIWEVKESLHQIHERAHKENDWLFLSGRKKNPRIRIRTWGPASEAWRWNSNIEEWTYRSYDEL